MDEITLKMKNIDWQKAFMEVQDFMLEHELWNETDVNPENPAQTLINGLHKFFNKYGRTSCHHEWKIDKAKEYRFCNLPKCGIIQIWNNNGYWDYPTEEQEKSL